MIIKPSNIGRGQSNTLPYTPNQSGPTAQAMFFMSAYPLEFSLFKGEQAVTTGQADPYAQIEVLGRNLTAIQVDSSSGTYNATVFIEGTLDGVTWSAVQSVTTPGIVQISGLYASLRASITAYVSGTIDVMALSQRT